jgi:hypothetical protein
MLGGGRPYRMEEGGAANETMSRLTGEPCLLSRGKAKEMVQKNWSCDITKVRCMLGYGPSTDLIRGAEITVDWYRRNNWL